MRFNVSSRGYNMFSRNISYRNDNFSLRNQARSITMVVDERGMTGAGIFDSIKNFGKKVINFGSKAGKSAYNAVNSALPYIEKGIDIIDKFGPVVDGVMEYNQHKLHPKVNSARKSTKKFVNKRRKDYESAKPVIDIIQSLRGSNTPDVNENEYIQKEKKSKPKLPAFDLRQQLINQSKNLKKSKPKHSRSNNDPMAELKARLSHIRNNVADDSDEEWDGAGLELAGRGMCGKGIYPAGLYTAGAGLGIAGAGYGRTRGSTRVNNEGFQTIANSIIPHMIATIMKGSGMSKKAGKQLLIQSLNKAQPLMKGSGKTKPKNIAKMAITPFQILKSKPKVVKALNKRIESMVNQGVPQSGGDFWDALGSVAAAALPIMLL